MNPTIFGVIGPGFLNQVPTLENNINYELVIFQSRDRIQRGLGSHKMVLGVCYRCVHRY